MARLRNSKTSGNAGYLDHYNIWGFIDFFLVLGTQFKEKVWKKRASNGFTGHFRIVCSVLQSARSQKTDSLTFSSF